MDEVTGFIFLFILYITLYTMALETIAGDMI